MSKQTRLKMEDKQMIKTHHQRMVKKGYRSALVVDALANRYKVSRQTIYYTIRKNLE